MLPKILNNAQSSAMNLLTSFRTAWIGPSSSAKVIKAKEVFLLAELHLDR